MKTQQLFIPTIGTEITLAKSWSFDLYDESRNTQMITFQGLVRSNSRRLEDRIIERITLPAGTVMKVDRIYIRKGDATTKEYDSVTFIVQSIPKVNISVPEKLGWGEVKTVLRKKIRFWAKLADVNKMFIVGKT